MKVSKISADLSADLSADASADALAIINIRKTTSNDKMRGGRQIKEIIIVQSRTLCLVYLNLLKSAGSWQKCSIFPFLCL